MGRRRDEAAAEHVVAPRTTLVPLAVEDADEMAEVLGATQLYEFIGGGPPSAGELRRRYERLVLGRSPDGRQDWYNFIIRLNETWQAVGTVQATVFDGGQGAEMAWVVGLAFQRRGYASEAARALIDWLAGRGVRDIMAHVHPGHHASMAVAGRVGLVQTDRFDDGERLWRRP